MSRFSSVVFFVSSLAVLGCAAPLAFAQTAVQTGVITAQSGPAMVKAPVIQASTYYCFTQDIQPGDNSSMLTVCSKTGPATVIFTP